MKIKLIFYFLIFGIIFLIFKSWFSFNSLSTGDWSYKFAQQINSFSVLPNGWDNNFVNGLGGNTIFLLPLNTYFLSTTWILFHLLNIPWVIIEKIVWFWPFLIVSISGAFFIFKKWLLNNNILALVSSLIFTTNSYALMVVGGGQVGVGMAYAFIPFVVLGFVAILEADNFKKAFRASLIAGVVFSLQFLLDLRIAYVTLVFLGIYYLVFLFGNGILKAFKKTFVNFIIIPALVTLGLHFFWLFPFVVLGQNPLNSLGIAYTGNDIVQFLSFAKFENTISLLHPNWPENIFGKVGFMRPEFLLIPILAFSAIIFGSERKLKNKLVILSLLGLIGAFLAKGASDPFGGLYLWLFGHFPGFVMFRDATKWYGIIALTFSLLIPYSLYKLSQLSIFNKLKSYSVFIFAFVFILFWSVTIRQAILGQLGGTFIGGSVPIEYTKLTDFLSNQKGFYRSLWVPKYSQFSYFTQDNPAIPAQDYFSAYNALDLTKKISTSKTFLEEVGVKYIIVPFDSSGTIFTMDRKYSEKVYKNYVNLLSSNKDIKKVKEFGKIVVFETKDSKDLFWSLSSLSISYKNVSPVEYKVNIKNGKRGDIIVFAQNYDSHWVAKNGNATIKSTLFNKLNSFKLEKDGSYTLKVYYQPQDLVNIGIVISLITLAIVALTLLATSRHNRNK